MQVVFRHGARTPLTKQYWHGTTWDVCGCAFMHPQVKVVNAMTGEAETDFIDGQLTHYEGGCTRGELTVLGQIQVRLSWCPSFARRTTGHQLHIRCNWVALHLTPKPRASMLHQHSKPVLIQTSASRL